MPINEYMSPIINQHQNTHVDTYEPINFQFLGNQLAKKQAEYDAGEALSHTITDNIKINPLFNTHKIEAQQIKDQYRSEIDRTLEEAGGNYALAVPKLQAIGRRLQDDLQYGSIAKINNSTQVTLDQFKNIKDISEKSGINGLDQENDLKRRMQEYDVPEIAGKQSFTPFNHGQRIKFPELLDKAVGNIKVDGYQKYDMSDPNYLTKFGAEYLTDKKVRASLQSTLKSQSSIKYEAMLALGVNSPEDVTDEQLTKFIDDKVDGTVKGAVFTNSKVDKNESETGKLGAQRKDKELDNNMAGSTQDIIGHNETGDTSTDVRKNYDDINATHRESIERALDVNKINRNNVIVYNGKKLKLLDALRPENAKELKEALQSGDFNFETVDGKTYDKAVLDNFKNGILPTLNKNEAVNQRVDQAINTTVDQLYKPGMMLVKRSVDIGRYMNDKYIDSDLTLINKNDYAKLARSHATGKKEGNTYMNDKGNPVVNGVEYFGTQFVNSSDRSKKGDIFNFSNVFEDMQPDNSFDKTNNRNIEATNNKVTHTFSQDPLNGIKTDNFSSTDAFDKVSNLVINHSNDITYFDVTDPYQQKTVQGGTKAALLAAEKLGIEGGVSAVPVADKKLGVEYSGTPHNGEQIGKQYFDIKDASGTVIDRVSVLFSVDNIVSPVKPATQTAPEYLINKGLINLRGKGNDVPLYYNNVLVDATLHNDSKQITYRNESGTKVTTTIQEALKIPKLFEVIKEYGKKQ